MTGRRLLFTIAAFYRLIRVLLSDLSAAPTISGPGFEISPGGMFGMSSRLSAAIFLSVILHAIVLFGINFQFPSTKNEHAVLPLEVTASRAALIDSATGERWPLGTVP